MISAYTFDIETTGLMYNDEVTCIGYFDGETAHIFAQATDLDTEDIWSDHEREIAVEVTQYNNETDLLEDQFRIIGNKICEGDTLPTLYGWYSQSWKGGGFDMPFLRTRYLANDDACPTEHSEFPFQQGIEHVDLKYIYNTQFNTKAPSAENLYKSDKQKFAEYIGLDVDGLRSREIDDELQGKYTEEGLSEWIEHHHSTGDVPTKDKGSLDEVFEIMFPDREYPDPVTEDEHPGEVWEEGRYEDVIVHNVSDLVKTWDLAVEIHDFVPSNKIKTLVL